MTLLLLLSLSLGWTTSYAKGESVVLEKGDPAPSEGVFYSLEQNNSLLRTLLRRRHRYEQLEDEAAVLKAHILVLQQKLDLVDLRLRNEEIRSQIAKDSCPSLWERKVGFCVGIGAGISTTGEVDAMAGVVYGMRW